MIYTVILNSQKCPEGEEEFTFLGVKNNPYSLLLCCKSIITLILNKILCNVDLCPYNKRDTDFISKWQKDPGSGPSTNHARPIACCGDRI